MKFQNKTIRILALTIVIVVGINAIGLIILGVEKTWEAWKMIILPSLKEVEDKPGLTLMKSVDLFLISLVFLIFCQGIFMLFVHNPNKEIDPRVPKWMRVNSFTELKFILVETVIVTLFIGFATYAFKEEFHLYWRDMIIPLSILILAVSMFFMKKGKE